MPTPGVNIAVNQLFASGTYGWRKDKLGSSFGFPTDDDGVTWGIPVWSNTLGTGPAAGGTRRLISQTSAFSKPAVDDGEQPIYGGTTPGDSPYCGITYIHDGAGFNVGPGEVWKFSCTISRLSYQDSIEFDIASWRNWGALAAVSPKLAQLWMHNGDFQQRWDDYIGLGGDGVSKTRFQQFHLPVLAVGWNISNPLVDFAGWEYIDGGPDWHLIDPADPAWNPPYAVFAPDPFNQTIDYDAGISENSAGLLPPDADVGSWVLTHGRESWTQQDVGSFARVIDPYLFDLGLYHDPDFNAASLHAVAIDLYFALPKWLYMGPVAPDIDGYGGWTCGDSEVVTFDPAGEPIYVTHAVGEDDAYGTGITFAIEPGVSLEYLFTQGTPPPVVETVPPAAPDPPTTGPIPHPEPPVPTDPGEACNPEVELTWDGAPTITFPDGCGSRYLGVEFVTPTPSRDPWHIVNDQGDQGIQPGTLPWIEAGLKDVWYGRGIRWYDLLIDGVQTQRIMADVTDPPGTTLNVTIYSNLEGIDFTVSHVYSLLATYEDVPPSITWIIDRTVNNPTIGLPPNYYNIWKHERATVWDAGYDPTTTSPYSDGEDWGPFGTDEPTWVPAVGDPLPFLYHEVTNGSCTTTSESPSDTFTCVPDDVEGPGALWDPAALPVGTLAPTTNPSPGFGTAPTPSSAGEGEWGATVFVSDDYGCGDLTSFQYEPPHGTMPGSGFAGFPFQWREDGGDLDTWYYMSGVLFFNEDGPHFETTDPPDDPTLSDGTYMVMGMIGGDNILWPAMGLALVRDHDAANPYTVTSCFDNSGAGSFYLGPDTWSEPAMVVYPDQPNCLQFAVKRITDPGGSAPILFWRFAVNGVATPENSWRPPPDFLSRLYGAPSFSFWGDRTADLTVTGSGRDIDWRLATIWMDDLQWSAEVEVGCNCTPRLAGVGIYLEPRTHSRLVDLA